MTDIKSWCRVVWGCKDEELADVLVMFADWLEEEGRMEDAWRSRLNGEIQRPHARAQAIRTWIISRFLPPAPRSVPLTFQQRVALLLGLPVPTLPFS